MEIEDRRKKNTFSKLKNSEVFNKLKKVKNIEFIACVFILAIALLLYSVISKAAIGSSNTDDVGAVQTQTELEIRLEKILEQIDGAGEVRVMVTYASEVTSLDDNTVTGVVVVASGANDIGVRLNLLQAVQTALKIDARYVDVFAKNSAQK